MASTRGERGEGGGATRTRFLSKIVFCQDAWYATAMLCARKISLGIS